MWINDLINDTLKRKDASDGSLKWSRTSLTMLTAWISVLWAFHYTFVKYGFNEVAFVTMSSIALGAKIADAYTKKITPPENEAK